MVTVAFLCLYQLLQVVSTAAFISLSRNSPQTPSRLLFGGYRRGLDSSSSISAVREATFGMGCFWEPAESLLKQPGILATTVGYTGCASEDKSPPTYDTVCFGNDYVEAVQVVYDDTVVPYSRLLDYFFEFQKPGIKRQYASIVFVDEDSEDGKEDAIIASKWKADNIASKIQRKDNLPYSIVQIEPLTKFYEAEEYHQKYWEKQRLRAASGVFLIAGTSGAYDKLFNGAVQNISVFGCEFSTLCNGAFLLGAGWMLLERLIARDVKELKKGDLARSVLRSGN